MIKLESSISNDIVTYVNNNIKPLYDQEKSGHNWTHIQNVIINIEHLISENSLSYNKLLNLYLAAIYHDISLTQNGDRSTHEKDSANIFRNDNYINSILNKEDIEEIADAIYTHRASSDIKDRSMLGKILFQADRCYYTDTPIDLFIRSRNTVMTQYFGLSYIEVSIKAIEHLIDKYGESGYAYKTSYFILNNKDTFKANMINFIHEAKIILGIF